VYWVFENLIYVYSKECNIKILKFNLEDEIFTTLLFHQTFCSNVSITLQHTNSHTMENSDKKSMSYETNQSLNHPKPWTAQEYWIEFLRQYNGNIVDPLIFENSARSKVLLSAFDKCISHKTDICPKHISFTQYERALIARNINTPATNAVISTQTGNSTTVTVPGFTLPADDQSSKAKRKSSRE
jgi:hypothetical protein